MTSKTSCLLKRAIATRLKIFRSEVLRITHLIAFIKQFNRLKFIQNQESIPQENLRVIELLEALLPAEDIPENYSNFEFIGSPATVTVDYVGELIVGQILVAMRKTCSTSTKSALESVNTNMFESSEISDISSGELSNESSPQRVPEIDIGGELNTKKKKEN